MRLDIRQGNNLDTLRALVERGEKFDLVELDGPYGAGLEAWDCLTEAEYIAHYAARLELVRQVLQPWGVVYLFGYPEMVALVRAWAQQTGCLHLRRWINWYKQVTAHKGRKVEAVAVFETPKPAPLWAEFQAWLRGRRRELELTVKDAMIAADVNAYAVTGKNDGERGGGGFLWFEAPSSRYPAPDEYERMGRLLDIPARFATLQTVLNGADDLTNLDFIGTHYAEDTRDLNDAGLRSKPVGLYLDLFRPVVPPRDHKRALVLYGGSGNAGIAAGRLGYAVTYCEADPARCALIKRRYAWGVERRDETPLEELGPLFNQEARDAA